MNCKKCLKQIPKFLNYEIVQNDIKDFVEHIEYCSECKEELTIELLVKEGINSLESGTVFDINKELHKRLEQAHGSIRILDNLNWVYYGLISVNAVALIIMLILLVFN